jgi:hypothetical protein
MKFEIRTKIENGKVVRNKQMILNAFNEFEGSEVLIIISKAKKHRSNNQNAFYWGLVIPIVQQGLKDATGEYRSAEMIHYNILLKMFAPENEIVNTETGECITEKITSSQMTTTQFCEYVMEIQKWGAEFLGIDIPNPNENLTLL